MLSFIILLLVFCYLFVKYYNYTGPNPVVIYFIGFVTFLLYCLEVYFLDTPYFISDELGYFNQEAADIHTYIDRITWYLVNMFEVKIDIFPKFGIKVINIPILLFTLYYLWKIFGENNNVFLIPILLPYLFILAIRDFRDIFVILLLVLMVYHSFYKLNMVKLFIVVMLMFFTRFYLVFTFGLIVSLYYLLPKFNFQRLIRINSLVINKRNFKRWLIIVIPLIVLLIIFYPVLYKKAYSLSFRLSWFFNENHIPRLTDANAVSTGYYIVDYLVGAVRYIFTPIPISMFKRLISGGIGYGILDDLFRFLNQLFYYVTLFYLGFNLKYMIRALSNMTIAQKMIILNLFVFVIFYTIYAFGGGHQRIKIPFQIAIVLLSIQTYKFKKYITNYE